MIKRVLDHVLEQDRPREQSTGVDINDTTFDPMLAQFDEMDDLAWLNTIDWTQGSWMDCN